MAATAYPYKENTYTLYSNAQCPYSQRARRAFKAAKIPFTVEEIDLSNKPEWYHLVNPQLKVPALRTPEGDIFAESLVISEYVADKFPEAQLLSSDATERAQLRLFIELFASRITTFIYRALRAAEKEDQEKEKESLLAGVRAVSEELARQWERPSGKGGPFWYGDKFGFAEINTVSFAGLFVVVAHYRGLTIPRTEEYAAFHRWFDAVKEHPGFTDVKSADDKLIEAYKRFVPKASS
ncbi:glutathione S-transferase [Martensiomyces pterosporus]|nr:glutathione S-transferase [Martensiomyces pterosporus]